MRNATAPRPVTVAQSPAKLDAGFLEDVLDGLGLAEKTLPAKYFYDERGSKLFDEICELDEYYPTRTETALLADHAGDIAAQVGPGITLLELGSGSSTKVRLLLDRLDHPKAYIPVDISREHLQVSAARLAADYPGLKVTPIFADYVQGFPVSVEGGADRTLAFFPGSTIGNFHPVEAQSFLARLARRLGAGSRLLIGVDLKKPKERLEAAYNDAAGVTAAFNLNLLERINRELDGTFDLDGFTHLAFYNDDVGRIEMHLKSVRDQTVLVAGVPFRFEEGETIHTEDSYKYSADEFRKLAHVAGWSADATWTDDARLFSIHLLNSRG
ncbi:dimethylhistidine N-methyltransferase [Skermanella aerolata]|uniref:Dimethylhistidine N-methyltransferase n=1 Tax=Skermanella aerolata TaxID=393310 RepID=A0A512DLI1_9PROT|nr:L-histidine N(alpha)-methyltransferase [Skermanella aerolata]KJB96204.1 methyltransferase [Skermanella aerolata KACC 11604]GEO37322.1 dimethylhistidine N-methyltransferase [Skermanella aerolata]